MPERTEIATTHGLADLIQQLVHAMTDPGAPYGLIDDILGEVEARYGAGLVSIAAFEAEQRIESFQWAARRWDGTIHTAESEGAARLRVCSANGEPSKRNWYTAVLFRATPDGEWVEVASDV